MLLEGLRVVDLGHYIAGPYCARLMAGLGAEVLKIEKPGEGDGARRMGPFFKGDPHPEKSGTFLYLNLSKKGLTLNLKTETGKKIFRDLVKDCDILVENFEPRVMPSLGLDYETLAKINPRLVMASISNFGQTGPYRDFKGEEITVFGLGGLPFMEAPPEEGPLKTGGNPAQYMAGCVAFLGSLAALYFAQETGLGQQVDISIHEVVTSATTQALVEYIYTGHRDKLGSRIGALYKAKDGYVSTSLQQPQWLRFPSAIGMPELLQDPRFATSVARGKHMRELREEVGPWMAARTKEEAYHILQKERLPAGYVATPEDLVQSAQYQSQGAFVEIDHPATGKVKYPGAPFVMDGLRWRWERAPLLGEHNEEVFCQRLSYSTEDLARLRQRGII